MNTLNTVGIDVAKDFSDDNPAEVTVSLDCGPGVVVDDDDTGADETDAANFTVKGFTDTTTCDATEGTPPAGYTADETGCQDLDPESAGTGAECTIVNTLNTVGIDVAKDFSDDNPAEVTVSLDCGPGVVVDDDDTGADETDAANFTVKGFTDTTTCDATEGTPPAGYTADETGCQDLDPESAGTGAECTIVNTLNTVGIDVAKDFSDDNPAEVTVSLDCGPGVVVDDDDTGADETDAANFTVKGFTDTTTCDATEGTPPAGYTADETGCQDLDPESAGTGAECTIVNTLNTVGIDVAKDFSDDNPAEVTVSLDCGPGVVVDDDDTGADETDAANFTVKGFTDTTTCDATEGTPPAGYTADETGCQDLDPESAGTGAECTIVNTLNTVGIDVAKDFSDDNPAEVTVSLDCGPGVVVDDDDTGADETDAANFTVKGFTDTTTCDATEGTPPAGYTADETGCQDLDPESAGTGAECTIVNTLNTVGIDVAKDFSDDNPAEVTVSLDCGPGVVVDDDDTGADETDAANFTVKGFTDTTTCDATEGTPPAGYTADETGCQDLDPESAGTGAECTIVNTLNTVGIDVAKDFSDDNPAEVTVSLDCGPGVVVDDDDTGADETDAANFTVKGFTDTTTCDATEGTPPAGYTADETGCQDLDPESAGTGAECTIVNTLNTATIYVQKDFSDNNSANVNVSLDCGTATETTVDGTASESDSAQFTVTGFDDDDTCTATEGTPPAGYAANEADCQNFDPQSKTTCTIQNVKELELVTRGGCTFDRNDSRALRQFPLIFTPDGSSAGHKLNATNPGQFFMNAAYDGDAEHDRHQDPVPVRDSRDERREGLRGVTTSPTARKDVLPRPTT